MSLLNCKIASQYPQTAMAPGLGLNLPVAFLTSLNTSPHCGHSLAVVLNLCSEPFVTDLSEEQSTAA